MITITPYTYATIGSDLVVLRINDHIYRTVQRSCRHSRDFSGPIQISVFYSIANMEDERLPYTYSLTESLPAWFTPDILKAIKHMAWRLVSPMEDWQNTSIHVGYIFRNKFYPGKCLHAVSP